MLRWVLFSLWTVFILYTMEVFTPSESTVVGAISQWFVKMDLPESTPAKLYHWWVFFVWSLLLGGALARGYWRKLPARKLGTCVCSLIAFGALTEGLQHCNPARTPALLDFALNLFGGALGLCFRFAACRLTQVKSQK
jgi:VanZ family protein